MAAKDPSNVGRPDIERVGLFSEVGYMSNSLAQRLSKDPRQSGKQFTVNPSKHDAYFTNFGRAFQGEGYTDMVALRRKGRLESTKKNVVQSGFLPSNIPPQSSGKGSLYGTIAKQYPLISNLKPLEPRKAAPIDQTPEKLNVYTSPAKKGGYGFVTGTIGKLPQYVSSPFSRQHEMEQKEIMESKSKVINNKNFMSVCPRRAYFENKAFITRPFTLEKDPPIPEPEVIWKPTTATQPFLNKFPHYEVPNPFPPKSEIDASVQAQIRDRKAAGSSSNPTYRPISTAIHHMPVRSIVRMNVKKQFTDPTTVQSSRRIDY